jgi:hypothetical protein
MASFHLEEGRTKVDRDREDLDRLDRREVLEVLVEDHEEVLQGRLPKLEELGQACRGAAASCGEEDPSCAVAFLRDLKVGL